MIEVNPILIEVIKNRLNSIMDESVEVMRRTARSGTIVEIVDCSTVIWNEKGQMLSQASAIPLHVLSLQPVFEKLIKLFPPDTLSSGDVLCTNDPYLGDAQHLPDIAMIIPIFYKDKIVGYAGTMAHHQDIGGICVGGMPGNAEEIYQEGIRIPPVKLIEKNEMQHAILDIISSNVRTPRDFFEGDLRAQAAGCNIVKERYIELLEKYSVKVVKLHENALLDYAEKMMALEISKIPEGEYEFTDYIESEFAEHKIHVNVKVRGGKIICDFSGSDSQIKLPLNCMFSTTQSMSVYSICCFLDPNIPKNAGAFKLISTFAEKGSIVYPTEPSPCGNRNLLAHRIPDLILGALSKVLPEKVIAACYGSTSMYTFAIRDKESNNVAFVSSVGPGGMGASSKNDGQDAVCCHVSNTLAFEMEAAELAAPLKVENYSIRNDSGGAGRYRGGCALNIQIKLLADEAKLSLVGGRHRISPYGLFGGKGGKVASYSIKKADGKIEKLYANSYLTLRKNDTLIYETAGGGGYGDPFERDIPMVLKDVKDKYVSIKSAEEDYGVVIDPKTYKLIGVTEKRKSK